LNCSISVGWSLEGLPCYAIVFTVLSHEQELLLILDEFWEKNPSLHNVPIYQASGLARRAMTIYQTYIEMMNDDIKTAFQARGVPCTVPLRHLVT
jgi:Cft2 family RNA processing exonuclease